MFLPKTVAIVKGFRGVEAVWMNLSVSGFSLSLKLFSKVKFQLTSFNEYALMFSSPLGKIS